MKKIILGFFVFLATLLFVGCTVEVEPQTKEITIDFEGAESITLKEGESAKCPSASLGAGQSLLGWALKANATKALVTENITYTQMNDYVSDKRVKLYPVIENKIAVTLKGLTEEKTEVSDIQANIAKYPMIVQSERQKFIGWALEEGADAVISIDTVLNYENLKSYAKDAKLTLYPAIITYDLMIAVHASHSNGNVYVSEDQKVELKAQLEKYFEDDNIVILVDFIDAVNATGFATEAVKKDYDILLTSKTARNAGETLGDIANAAALAGKGYYGEADSAETVVSAIELNQSRQVVRMLGSEETKEYQEAAYTFFTTPIDYVVEITFKNGTKEEKVEAHRVVDGVVSQVAYVPTEESGIMTGTAMQVFDGWTTVENGTEVEFANASYANVANVAVGGKVTLYPVFTSAPDVYIVVWGVNGSNEYVSKDQFETIKTTYQEYLTKHHIDITGKKIEIAYFEGNTNAFKAELTKAYVSAAVGASALSNDDYAQYWTIATGYFASVLNVKCTNTSRYCAIREGYEENELVVAFLKALCEKEITVKFSDGKVTTEGEKVNSVTKNAATLPETITTPVGYDLIGYALTKDATEALITGSVNYDAVAKLADENNSVTLYPVYAKYDLVVYVWGGQSKTGTTYMTEEDTETLKNAFITSLGAKAEGKKIMFNVVWGKTANYGALVGAEADVIISGGNLNTEAQCGALLDETYGKMEVINYLPSTGSTRYAGVCKKALDNELAKALIVYLCEATLTVTFEGNNAQQLNKVYGDELVVPTYNAPTGKEFKGFATTKDATTIEFTTEDLTFAKLAAKATENAITLYPVYESVSLVTKKVLKVAILCGTASKRYITAAEIEGIKKAFEDLLAEKNITDVEVQYIVNEGDTGANFNASLPSDVAVIIGAGNLASQGSYPGLYEGVTATTITNKTLISNTSRAYYISASCPNDVKQAATLFGEMLTK